MKQPPPPLRSPLEALGAILASVDAVRNLRALYVLLATFAASGLLMAMARSALARDAGWLAAVETGAALFIAFYGANAAGILLMDQARGRPVREVPEALRAAAASAHRVLAVLLGTAAAVAVLGGVLVALLWVSRTDVAGPVLGPAIFGAVVPLGAVAAGLLLLSLAAVVVPLAAPGVWAGRRAWPLLRQLAQWARHRLLTVALLMGAVSLLSAGVGALATFVLAAGGRVVAQLAVAVVGVDVPLQQLTAGLFGYGVRSLGAVPAPAESAGHVAAALVGGGVVFPLALVLPGLVYLRGACTVYLALDDDPPPGLP